MVPRILSASLALGIVLALFPVSAWASAPIGTPHRAHTNVHRASLARPAAMVSPAPSGYIPCDIATAYGLNKAPGDGAGLTIAVINAFHLASAAADYTQFNATLNVVVTGSTFTQHPMASTMPDNAKTMGWADEIDLDIEWVHAMAPAANLVLVEAVSADDAGLGAAIDWAVQQGADVVSMSWSIDEVAPPALTLENVNSLDAHFPPLNGAGRPVAYLAATGDRPSATSVGWPSDSTRVIAVGGTSLAPSAAGEGPTPGHMVCTGATGALGATPQNETAWGSAFSGPSAIVPRPAFQAGVSTDSHRVVPDLAMTADSNNGLAVYSTSDSGWTMLGGDSGATAVMAGVLARLNTGRAPVTQPGDLYQLASANGFNDVITGTSGGTCAGSPCAAGPGFDKATGFGSPRVTSLFPRGRFTPVTPSRILDTRTGLDRQPPGGAQGRLQGGMPIEVGLPVPPSPSSAVVVNLTAINADPGGWVAAFAGGTTYPGNSNLNTTAGAPPIANLVQVPVGADGKIAFLSSGSVDLAVDLFGWVSDSTTPPAGAARLVPVPPQRIIDSRPVTGWQKGPYSTPWSAGEPRPILYSTFQNLVSPTTTALVLNVTAVDESAPGWLSVFPTAYNNTSNVNYVPGVPMPNRVIVPLDPTSHTFSIESLASSDVLVDITGYFDTSSSPSAVTFTSAGPVRIYDSRPGTVAVTGQAEGPVPGRGTRRVAIGGLAGIPQSIKEVALNVTIANPEQVGFFSAIPGGATWTGNSDLNIAPGAVWTNQVIVPVAADGTVDFFNGSYGGANLIVDFLGWYG